MKRREILIAGIAALTTALVLIAAPAHADLTITMETDGVEHVIYMTSDMLCVKDADGSMVFDSKNQVVRFKDPDGNIRQMTKKDLEAMGSMARENAPDEDRMAEYREQMADARKKAVEAIKDLPEGQQKAAMEMLDKQLPPEAPGSDGSKRTYEPMNKKEKIGAYNCVGYTARKGDAVVGEIWTADFDELEIKPDDVVVIGKLRDFFRAALKDLPMMEEAMADFEVLDPKSDSFIGFPIRQIEIDGGKKETTQLVSIDKGTVDAKVFELGAD